MRSSRRLGLIGILAGALAALPTATAAAPDSISLEGPWAFRLDRDDRGGQEKWWESAFSARIRLPGALQAQGYGDEVSTRTSWTGEIVDRSWFTAPEYEKYRKPGNVKVPFWLQPERHYVGPAWYQRAIEVPRQWAGKRIVLSLERPHWETRVWLDGRFLGSNNSLSTPHVYDLGTRIPPGRHRLAIRVDNRLVVDVGINSHSVTDHTQSNWNGIAGRLALEATEPVAIDDLQVYPHVATRSISVKGRLANATGQAGQGRVRLAVEPAGAGAGSSPPPTDIAVTWNADGGSFQAEYPLGSGAALWDEFHPAVYRLSAALDGGPPKSVTFGLREIATRGTQFVLNGRKIFIRGTLECCIFPLTGYPPTDVDSWKRIIGVAKAHGLNNFRFHSWCPPEAAFAAADELGFYLHVECASWANQSTTLGDGKPVDEWIYQEADRILEAYGNHPSFVLMLYGNEPGGARHAKYLAQWVEHYKAGGPPKRWVGKDPRRLYSGAAGWPQIPENQFHVAPQPRIQAWGGGLKSRINARPPETQTDYRDYIAARSVPVISHEIGQWCVYPNFEEIPKYTGHLKPKNFEIFRDTLSVHHMAGQARDFLLASGKLQTLCYKEEIESALRTPGMGGFQLLDLHDFPGQGTALVGVLDPFWDSKGYVTADEYRRFCNSTVPLARMPKRVWTTGETLEAELEVAHFGPEPLSRCTAQWKLVAPDGRAVAAGKLPPRDVPVDNGIALGSLRVDLKPLPAPSRYRLVVGLAGTRFENDWDVWVYPAEVEARAPQAVAIVEDLTQPALDALRGGGKVLLMIPPQRVKGDPRRKIALGFSSIFWNTAWTRGQAPHTLGILCDPKHPALAEFPTEFHSNWQWWYLVTRAQPMILDALPPKLRPTVQVIDDWFTNRRLGLVLEARLGGGKLLVSSIDLRKDLDRNPVARQMLHSLLDYAAGERFQPEIELTAEQVRELIAEPSAMERLGARVVKADSAEPGFEPQNAIDGDPSTIWHTAWSPQPPGPPHEIQIELGQAAVLRGIAILPRQDGNPNGQIKDYACYASGDGKEWGEAVATGSLGKDPKRKTIRFARPVEARYVRLVALSSVTGGPWTSIAELELLPESR